MLGGKLWSKCGVVQLDFKTRRARAAWYVRAARAKLFRAGFQSTGRHGGSIRDGALYRCSLR